MSQAQLSTVPSHAPTALAPWLLAGIGAWFLVILTASLAGVFASPAESFPWPIVSALALPLVLFTLLYRIFPRFEAFILDLDPRPLVLIHSFRMVGLGFLLLSAYGVLPLVFAVPAGGGDALAALGALLVGIALYSTAGVSRRLVVAWNGFGLADFAVAVGVGILSRSNGVLHFSGSAPSDAMGTFPLALIPAFAVPLYLITHVIILLQLRRRWKHTPYIRLPR